MNLLTDPLKMIRDIRALDGGIGNWGAALNIPQVLGGLIFINKPEGLAVLLTVLLTLLVAGQIHRRENFSRLTSICHLPWLVLVPWLLMRMVTQDHSLILSLWLGYVVITIVISLVLDARELWLFSQGKRVFAWAKPPSQKD